MSCCSNRALQTTLIPKPAQLDVIRRKHPVCGFYLGKEREDSNICLTFQIFRGLFEGFISVSPPVLIELAYVGWLGVTENKRAQWFLVAPENIHNKRESLKTERDYEVLKKKIGNITPTSPEGYIPIKGLKDSRNLLPA